MSEYVENRLSALYQMEIERVTVELNDEKLTAVEAEVLEEYLYTLQELQDDIIVSR